MIDFDRDITAEESKFLDLLHEKDTSEVIQSLRDSLMQDGYDPIVNDLFKMATGRALRIYFLLGRKYERSLNAEPSVRDYEDALRLFENETDSRRFEEEGA